MRGGAFADRRVIDLVNQRMVGFYFCFRQIPPDAFGYDAEAAEVHNALLKGNPGLASGVPPAIVASPGAKKVLGLIGVFAQLNKDAFSKQLHKILKKHGYIDAYTAEEKKCIIQAEKNPSAATHYAVGNVYEKLGKYELAVASYTAATHSEQVGEENVKALEGLARIERYKDALAKAENYLKEAEQLDPKNAYGLADDIAMERAHILLKKEKYEEAKDLLQRSILADPQSNRLGEMHYYLGVAYFFLKEKEKSYFHWWYVIKELGHDRHHTRCFISLAAEAYPFPNYELKNYRGVRGAMTIDMADKERVRTEKIYAKLKDGYGKVFFEKQRKGS